jgi:hypothetical protein
MNIEMNKIVNATPHDINLMQDGEVFLTIPPSMAPIRLHEEWSPIGTFDMEGGMVVPFEFPTFSTLDENGEEIELPELEHGVFYVVSKFVAEAFWYRADFLIPGKIQKDENGRICGCECLSHVRGKDFCP